MSKVLVVKAHPLEANASRTVTVLDAFLNTYKENNPSHEIDVLELYNSHIPEIDKDVLEGWGALQNGGELTEEQANKVTRFAELTDQFISADKIIIANPMWNASIPARLKAWIDTTNVAGKTFRYTETGPLGLATDKKLMHIQSSGGVTNGDNSGSKYVKNIFGFIGVTDADSIFIEGIDHDPSKEEEVMTASIARAVDLASKF